MSVNKSELRTGNFVYPHEENATPYPVLELHKDVFLSFYKQFEWQEDGLIKYADAEPIPLTPEILEKCGFVKEVFDNSHEEDGHFYSLRLSEDRYVDLSLLSGGKNDICEVFLFPYEQLRYRYLHQIQNIVHSLTGKELQINF